IGRSARRSAPVPALGGEPHQCPCPCKESVRPGASRETCAAAQATGPRRLFRRKAGASHPRRLSCRKPPCRPDGFLAADKIQEFARHGPLLTQKRQLFEAG